MSKKYNLAAVIALIYSTNGQSKLLLTKRSHTLDLHPGEISLPGGRQDTTDLDLKDTALRECEEEVGIHRDQVKIIGELGSFITNSNFEIFAFIATLTGEIELTTCATFHNVYVLRTSSDGSKAIHRHQDHDS